MLLLDSHLRRENPPEQLQLIQDEVLSNKTRVEAGQIRLALSLLSG